MRSIGFDKWPSLLAGGGDQIFLCGHLIDTLFRRETIRDCC
jgi:hypothetical protein